MLKVDKTGVKVSQKIEKWLGAESDSHLKSKQDEQFTTFLYKRMALEV